MLSLTVYYLVKDRESSSWGQGADKGRKASLRPQTSGRPPSPVGTRQVGWERRQNSCPKEQQQEVSTIAHGRLPAEGTWAPTGSNTDFETQRMVALRFHSVSCLGCGVGLSLFQRWGPVVDKTKMDRIMSWMTHIPGARQTGV